MQAPIREGTWLVVGRPRSFESYEAGNTVACGRQAENCSVVAVYFVGNPYRPMGSTASAPTSFEPHLEVAGVRLETELVTSQPNRGGR